MPELCSGGCGCQWRTCLSCSKPFPFSKDRAARLCYRGKYCSRRCACAGAKKERIKNVRYRSFTCQGCGKSESRRLSRNPGYAPRFCGIDCRRLYENGRRKRVVCIVCRKTKLIPFSRWKRRPGKYCGNNCFRVWCFQRSKAVPCKNCHRIRRVSPGRYKKRRKLFCNRKCRRLYEHGKSPLAELDCAKCRDLTVHRITKREVRGKGYTCLTCGTMRTDVNTMRQTLLTVGIKEVA